jgi:2-polyprenyl-3-methyl-5-hydroxy-6-metoxy-1,4-benzoquinol methylase
MSDVFGFAVAAAGDFLRDAAIDAGYELGLFDGSPRTLDQIADANEIGNGRWRLGALLDVLVALGALVRRPETALGLISDDAVRRADDAVRRADDAVRVLDDAIQRADGAVRVSDAAVHGLDDAVRRADDALRVAGDAVLVADDALRVAGDAVRHADDKNHVSVGKSHVGASQTSGEPASRLAARLAPWRGVVFERGEVPTRPATLPRTGWRAMVDVFRRDKALDVEGGEIELRYHRHLIEVGAAAARELAAMLTAAELETNRDRAPAVERATNELGAMLIAGRAGSAAAELAAGTEPARRWQLLDLGCGAGTFTAAVLDAQPDARATVVDFPEVIALAREHLARFGERVAYVPSAIETSQVEAHDVALLANVVHLHAPEWAQRLLVAAAERVAPGGRVMLKDLRLDADRSGPLSGLMFALNMAIYTGGGSVYTADELRDWLEAAGLVAIEERRLAASPDSIVMLARKPPHLPRPLRRALAHAAHARPDLAPALQQHYRVTMPAMRAASLAPSATREPTARELLATPLDWARLPRMRDAIGRLFDLCEQHDAHVPIAGATSAAALFARTRTLAQLVARTHYGGCMPLLYGYPADLAYFVSRGLDAHATIDRYLVAPILHELCHFAPERDALPPHLDECIAGWLAVHVWPEFAYPAPGCDDAIYAAPWLAQIGQAFARRFGIGPIVRAHSGSVTWREALPADFVGKLERIAWADWDERGTLHFLSDTFDPEPWLAIVGGRAVLEDPVFDRAIVADALRAMCLATERVDGSFRTRSRVPEGSITIEVPTATTARVTTARHTEHDVQPPRYWLPASIAAAIRARGHAGYELYLGSVEVIPAVVATLCDGAPPKNFTLVPAQGSGGGDASNA